MKLKPRNSGILLIALLSVVLLNTIFPGDLLATFEIKPCRNWDVLVYVDDEMLESQFIMYKPYIIGGFDLVSAKIYAGLQVLRGSWQYNVQFGYTYRVVDVLEWESSDHLNTARDVLFELVQKKWMSSLPNKKYKEGECYDGNTYDKRQILIIGFTKQALIDKTAGICWICDEWGITVNAILISYTTTWIDDNVIMHELGHLHGLVDHPENDGCQSCVMEYAFAPFIMWYNEPLQPLYDSHVLLDISFWSGCIRGGFIHYTFCGSCKNKVKCRSNPSNYFDNTQGEILKWDGNEGISEEMPKPGDPKPTAFHIIITIVVLSFGIYYFGKWLNKKLRRNRDET